MLEKYFPQVYTKFKMKFYQTVFATFEKREATLSVVETFCVEVIYALGSPTVKEFAEFAQISPPNAAYKVQNLIKKGYIKKVQNSGDKREFYLQVTDKYLKYVGITYDYIGVVVQRMRERFCDEDIEKLEEILQVLSEELMPEVSMKSREFE